MRSVLALLLISFSFVAQAISDETQNIENVISAAKLPDGYAAGKTEIAQGGNVVGVRLVVSQEGKVSKVIVTREDRMIDDPDKRLAAAKGYVNGTYASMRNAGLTIKTKELPKLENVDFAKPYGLNWEFADANGKSYYVDIKVIFTTQGYLITMISDDPKDRDLLRSWIETIKPPTE